VVLGHLYMYVNRRKVWSLHETVVKSHMKQLLIPHETVVNPT